MISMNVSSLVSSFRLLSSRSTHLNYPSQDPPHDIAFGLSVPYPNEVIFWKLPILLLFKSLYCFCLLCLFSISWARSGFTRLKRVRRRRFINNSAGVAPVVLCGVVRYLRRKSASLCSMALALLLSKTCFTKASFTTLTDRSAAPFDWGWLGGTRVCLIPFLLINSPNSLEVNCGPLSDTTSSGKQCWGKYET